MSRASNLAKAIGADGTLNVSDVAGLAAVASSGSASDLSTGTLPIARIADGAVTAAKLASGSAVSNIGYTPANKAGDTISGNIGLGATADTKLTIAGDSHQVGFMHMGGTAGNVNSWGSKHSTSSGNHLVNCNSVEFNGTGYTKGLFLRGDEKGLTTDGRLRVRRSEYAWYQYGGSVSGRYLHIKTSLWGGGSPSGNSQPTMSAFHGVGYNYDGQTIDTMIGFHNWAGGIFSFNSSNAGSRACSNAAYIASSGHVVLVFDIGTSYPGITIDYHQAYPYTYQDVSITSVATSTSQTGVY